ncbi:MULTISPECIES: type VI secretion system membrane subunit TssM [unclassified Azospirillum]|uniref:type VI secretion system membrane subunit TssM n=1 Tax=unclassified Azospirillum TaxID=2630922 RepID=UPI000B66FF7D|nr:MULTISPECIES: type VI secretion system membrane subunit TssM [unclassified Azospirillum]SNS92216.1 type VI secretion system protein ImpL [Azospirillum sp. RU38E]SNT09165.1 type VI secretion system protein ImpL [Azospirillum sp. RU37A]
MNSIISLFKVRWFLTLLGAIALALIAWLVGPFIAIADIRPLESEIARLLAVLVILVSWGVANIIILSRARQTDATLVDGMLPDTKRGADSTNSRADDDLTAMRDRLREAVRLLKQSGGSGRWDRRFLYQLPWYMMIGPPGTGKSTAIANSELVKRMAGKRGRPGTPDLGTHNCEWLFTDDAVLIDTAGRYTSQDSDAAADAKAWRGFLALLRKTRARQPINGVFVAFSAIDLAGANDAERARHARTIRDRLNELHTAFGIRFPVYLLLTKVDLLPGFTEFFDDLDRRQREQVWGVTFPLQAQDEAADLITPEFDLLMTALSDRVTTRLQQETDLGRRGAIFGFPAQVAQLREQLRLFLREAFDGDRYEAPPLLRGVYLTSGTQEGSPIDRLAGSIARGLGMEQSVAPPRPGTGRSYFLTGLLRDVVFPEAGLVSFNPGVERWRRGVVIGLYALAGLALAGSTSVWMVSYLENQAMLATRMAEVERIGADLRAIPADAALSQSFGTILPPLARLRILAQTTAEEPSLWQTFGLSQGEVVAEQAQSAYHRALNALLVPVMAYRLEWLIRSQPESNELYGALKAYLMLTGQQPGALDRDFLRQWHIADWAAIYPAPNDAAIRDALANHLDVLLAGPVTPIGPDMALVEQSRRLLANFPLAARAYAQLRQSPEAWRLAEWRLVDAAGPLADRVFVRPSGKLLSNGVPGFYTRAGFREVFLNGLSGAAGDVAKDSWVINGQPTADLRDGKLERDILQLYLNDYIAQWNGVLGDIALAPMLSLDDAMRVTAALSGPGSPLKNLLTAISAETTLTGDDGGVPPGLKAAATVAAGNLPIPAAASGLRALDLPSAGQPGKPVDDHFKGLHDFVNNKTSVAGGNLDDVLRVIGDLYLQLSRLKGGALTRDVMGTQGATPAEQLAAAAARAPGSVGQLLEQVGRSGSSATMSNARSDLGRLWNASVRRHCEQATGRRYPFNRRSDADTPLRDFAELFKPNGALHTFFTANLQHLVDTGPQRWRWQRINGNDLGISPAVLDSFQQAAEIREAMFANPVAPSVRFDLLTSTLPPSVAHVTLEIDGQVVRLEPGLVRPATLQWPGIGAGGATVTITPATGAPEVITHTGPWALFRLVDQSRPMSAGSPESIRITVGALYPVSFVLRANTTNSPFTLPALSAFQCPGDF